MRPGESRQNPIDGLAARLVGLDGSLGPTESIGALCRKLRDEEFLPDPLVHEALLTIAGQPIRGDSLLAEQAEMIHEQRLHDAVEEFAAEFFSIPVEARIARWNGLIQNSEGNHRRIERLNSLKPGLTIDAESFVDPSPGVQRLINDILAFFPMSHARRAAESRARADRFRNDASLSATDRSRALKRLRKRHRDIAALSQNYLAGLERPRRTIPFHRIRSTLARNLQVTFIKPQSFSRVLIQVGIGIVLVLNLLGRTLQLSAPSPAPYAQSPPASSKPFIRTKIASTPEWITWKNLVRDEFKGRIRRELKAINQDRPEVQLDKLIDRLPIDELPKVGDVATIILNGFWTETMHSRFLTSLKEGLRGLNLELTDDEIDQLAMRCLPSPTPSKDPTPQRNPTP